MPVGAGQQRDDLDALNAVLAKGLLPAQRLVRGDSGQTCAGLATRVRLAACSLVVHSAATETLLARRAGRG